MPRIIAPTVAEHRARTREALLDAVDALIAERGFENVSMRDIAERAHVSRTAIYNYAPDRLTLLAASVERRARGLHGAIAEVAGDAGASAPLRVERLVRLLLSSAREARNLHTLRAAAASLTRERHDEALGSSMDAFEGHLREAIVEGAAAGDYPPVADARLTTDLLAGLLDAAVGRVLASPDQADALADEVVLLIQRALGRREPGRAAAG